jgi:hypothetical protein
MAEAIGMQVVERHQKLFKVVSADFTTEITSCKNKVEKFATRNQLLGDVSNFSLFSVLVSVGGIFFEGKVLNKVRMVKFRCLLKLIFAILNKLLGEAWLVFLKDLKCDLGSIKSLTFLDFTTVAFSKGASNNEVVNFSLSSLHNYFIYK